MSKRLMQERKAGEVERVVAKSKPVMSLVSKTVARSPVALGSSAPHTPGTLKPQVSDWGSPVRRDP